MAYKPRKDIKVSESYIQKLRDAGSKKAALEKYGTSTDPKMREALRRFYGASAPASLGDTKRAKLATLPRKSVPMGKSAPRASSSKTTMGSRTAGKITVDTAANEKRKAEFNKRTDRAVAVASLIPAVRAGRAIAGTAKVKDTAKFYGDAARNMAPRAKKATEMRNTQQAVAAASKKRATGLQGAATRKANAKAAEKARLERNAKAAATRAANKKAAAKRATKAGK